jgi:hypothetical protein
MILFTLMMEAIRSSEMSVLTRTTRSIIPEGGIFHSPLPGNLNPYRQTFISLKPYIRPTALVSKTGLHELTGLYSEGVADLAAACGGTNVAVLYSPLFH